MTASKILGLLMALSWLAGACTAPREPQISGLKALRPFFAALDDLRHGDGQVVILQIGDSHTANDGFSGRLRELLQGRFGNAGRGLLPPGIPFRYYSPAHVHVEAAGWTVVNSFDPAASGPFGLTGVRQSAVNPAVMTLHVDEPSDLDKASVEVLLRPGGGTVTASFDNGEATSFSTNSARSDVASFKLPSTGATTMTMSAAGDGRVDILSWTFGRNQPGVTYSNLGTIGATVDILGRWDKTIVDRELAALRPALILLAFGTNEGFRNSTDVRKYIRLFADRVRLLRDAAPDAAVVIMGPPDGSVALPISRSNETACPDQLPGPTRWSVPGNLAPVRAAQRQVATDLGLSFWDWSDAMGGFCSMVAWAETEPPLAARDHIHLLRAGYRLTAEKLYEALMEGYSRYLANRQG